MSSNLNSSADSDVPQRSVSTSAMHRVSRRDSMENLAGSDDLKLALPRRPDSSRQVSAVSLMPLPTGSVVRDGDSVELYAGQILKPFKALKNLLVSRSNYFKDVFEEAGEQDPPVGNFTFPNLDEFAMALFIRWLDGGILKGPNDFHSMHHYLGLYILATEFRIERLKNECIDLIRQYYRRSSMTAPPYRLEYLYENTDGPSPMREFLIQTAAYRVLCEGGQLSTTTSHNSRYNLANGGGARPGYLSDSMQGVVQKGGQLAIDLCEALAKLHQNGLEDVRKVGDCTFHEHKETPNCKQQRLEPYQ